MPKDVIVVGQSAGGWAVDRVFEPQPPQVKAIIIFAAGRGGRVDGKPNNNCAPDRLVEATGEFGRTSRVPMLWIYIENDTFSGLNCRSGCTRRSPLPAATPNTSVSAVRRRRAFFHRRSRRHPNLVATGGEISRQATIANAASSETQP